MKNIEMIRFPKEIRLYLIKGVICVQYITLYGLLSLGYTNEGTQKESLFPGIPFLIYAVFYSLIPLIYIQWNRQFEKRKKLLLYQEKTENPTLTAWKDTKYTKLFPWHMVYILIIAFFSCIITPATWLIPIFLLLALIQYFMKKYTTKQLEKKEFPKTFLTKFYKQMNSVKDASFLWPDYSQFALLMKDDTNKIPVTFNRGILRPSIRTSYLFFDYEKDVKINPLLMNSASVCWVYLHAKFYVYVLDVSLYENIHEKIQHALTFARHDVEKPVYIFLLSDKKESLRPVVEYYSWIPTVKIDIVYNIHQINLEKVREDYLTGINLEYYTGYSHFSLKNMGNMDMNKFFKSCNLYSTYIYRWIFRVEDMYYYRSSNYYFCCFFHNMFRHKERKLAILAGFDYVDMILRFVLYQLVIKKGKKDSWHLLVEDIQSLGDGIVELLDKNDCIYETAVEKSVPVKDSLENALLILEKYFPIRCEGDTMNFQGLVYLLRVVRNQTRGHGSIQDTIVEPLWYALYVLCVQLNDMLQVYNLELRIQNNKVFLGYTKEKQLYDLDEYAIVSSDMPCPLYEIKKGKKEYINYFKGNFIIPDIVGDDD